MRELEALSARQLESVIAAGTATAVVPFGSVENHGGHLPLGADAFVADAVGREVARRLDAVLAPTFRIGDSAKEATRLGTLTLRSETVTRLACEVAESLHRCRIHRIAFVSAHGGNLEPLGAAATRLRETLDDCLACVPAGDVGPDPGSYSGKWLTSVMLVLRPDLVHVGAASGELREELRGASPEAGSIYLERFVASVVEQVRALLP